MSTNHHGDLNVDSISLPHLKMMMKLRHQVVKWLAKKSLASVADRPKYQVSSCSEYLLLPIQKVMLSLE